MKLLLLLLAFPMIGFGQKCISGNCVNGTGTYTYADGEKYIGEYINGLMHGQGTYTWANGAKYIGEYMNGKKNGQGTYTSADGTITKGLWENDKFVGE